MAEPDLPRRWVKLLDQSRCIGCHACTTACKSENGVPVGVTRTFVKSVEVGTFPNARRSFQVTRCNQCEDAPCVAACPTSAMYRRDDGIVDFDKSACIGCKACMAACPYDAIFINPEDHSAEKCNMCAHRLDLGLEPACVTACPTDAIRVGDLNDPASPVARLVGREPVQVRRPEKQTRPGVFYLGADQATLDPLAARRPAGGLLAWATLGDANAAARQPGGPGRHNSSAAALLSYDVPHQVPWGWRVSLYTWTKGIAAGSFAALVLLTLLGFLRWSDAAVRIAGPVIALNFLGITGCLLIWDLKHPSRFYLILTRPQWRSWLVRGSVVLLGYGAVVAGYLLAGLTGLAEAERALGWAGLARAAAAAVYTAFLFAQARARDLWQSPLLAPHLAVQAMVAGAAVAVPLAHWLAPASAARAAEVLLAVTAAAHLLFAAAEVGAGHPTAHARQAAEALTHGRQARFFWPAAALAATGIAAPWAGWPAAAAALAGLLAYEHAYVQAGQSVPLA